MFHLFCDAVKEIALEHQKGLLYRQATESSSNKQESKSSQRVTDPSLTPNEFFLDPSMYSEWDESTGLPLADIDGKPLAKSAMKRIRKLYEAQKKRHEKYLSQRNQQVQDGEEVSSAIVEESCSEREENHIEEQLHPNFLTVVQGTFGKRQALEFTSDMGPFCHVLELG